MQASERPSMRLIVARNTHPVQYAHKTCVKLRVRPFVMRDFFLRLQTEIFVLSS